MKGGGFMEKRKIFIAIALLVALMPLFVGAAILPTPSPAVGGNPVTLNEIGDTIQLIARWLIVISVVIAVIMIIWGGIMWMAARGDDKKVEAARKTIWNGIFGAAIVLAVGVIMQTIASVVNRGFFN